MQEQARETRSRPPWISEATWTLVQQRTPGYTQAALQRLTRQVNASLKEDWKRQVMVAGDLVEANLAPGNVKGAWDRVKLWYKGASNRPPKPSREELGKVTDQYAQLYTKLTPPGGPISVIVEPFNVSDEVPDEDKIAATVRRLHSGKSPGPCRLQTDQLKDWL